MLEMVRPGMEDSESGEKQENTGIGPGSACCVGRRECVLCENVSRDARPHPEERACRRSAPSSKARTRVSKDEDVHAALMLRDASQRIWALEAPALASRCDAPQHEGEGRRTNLWVYEIGAGAISLFRVVINNGFCNSNVLGRRSPMCHPQM